MGDFIASFKLDKYYTTATAQTSTVCSIILVSVPVMGK